MYQTTPDTFSKLQAVNISTNENSRFPALWFGAFSGRRLRSAFFAISGALFVMSGCTTTPSNINADNTAGLVDVAANQSLDITIYHLEGRRSERIVWLMEELELPYELVFTRGDLRASMAKIREVNPDIPMAPTVVINDQVLVESVSYTHLTLPTKA